MARMFKVGKAIWAWEQATGKRMNPAARDAYRRAWYQRVVARRLYNQSLRQNLLRREE